jgi:hypothetical protein
MEGRNFLVNNIAKEDLKLQEFNRKHIAFNNAFACQE